MKYKAVFYDDYDIKNDADIGIKHWQKTLIYFLAVAVIFNIIAFIYVKSSEFIYFGDNAVYWAMTRRIADGSMSAGGFWRNVYNSIALEDCNCVAALPSVLLAYVFGTSRLSYVLGIVNMYLIPSYFVIYLLAKKLSKAPKAATTIIIFLCPAIAYLALCGLADTGALLMCLTAYNLYYTKKDAPDRFWRYPIIGALLVLVIIWRKYFAFFSVSFLTAMLADCMLFGRKWRGVIAVIVTAALILLFFFRDFFMHRLMMDYRSLYASFRFTVMTDIKIVTRYFGLIFMSVLAVCSVILAVKKKEYRTFFMWLQMTVSFVMFIAILSHSGNHLLLYIPSFTVLTLIMIKYITKEWMLIAVCTLALLHWVFVYVPREQPEDVREIRHISIIPTVSMLPPRRADADELLALKRRLDSSVYEGDVVGVLASSFKLNEDIMKYAEISLGAGQTRPDYIVPMPEADSLDKDPSPLYTVNYILTAFPAQTHLKEGSQTIITEGVRSFENYADIALCYEEVPECETVIDGITIKLYHRVRDASRQEIADYRARLFQ